MRIQRRFFKLVIALALLGLCMPLLGADFGDAKDVKQVRKVVVAKFGHALHASVSHDWALCTASSGESDLSVVLHRNGPDWKIVESDGGAYAEENLKALRVPAADIPSLLKAYQ
jgi:hypothetical protein